MLTVHRGIERVAATDGEVIALQADDESLTFRDLNRRANALARHLIAGGFRRGDRAVIALPASPERLIAELATLKAGGAYAHPTTSLAYTVTTPFSVLREGVAHGLDIAESLGARPPASPNLPILVRESEPACLVADEGGALTVEVRHGDIAMLTPPTLAEWSADAARFEHWAVLMRGGSLTLPRIPYLHAA